MCALYKLNNKKIHKIGRYHYLKMDFHIDENPDDILEIVNEFTRKEHLHVIALAVVSDEKHLLVMGCDKF